jgi:predicted aspartyl protease
MRQFDDLLLNAGFATGVSTYEDWYPGEQAHPRVVLTVAVEERFLIQAVVDTGAPWCILDPEVAQQVGVSPENGYAAGRPLLMRGFRYAGRIHRLSIGLRNEVEGDDLQIEATVFVPEIHQGESWKHPNSLGLSGLLERIRFAVDPADNAFYFALV